MPNALRMLALSFVVGLVALLVEALDTLTAHFDAISARLPAESTSRLMRAIGHGRAIFVGLDAAIRELRAAMDRARGAEMDGGPRVP